MNKLAGLNNINPGPNLRSIDALRGYAVILVIGMHVIGNIPSLAWPAKRFLLLGANGVQLFFLASAVTLLMSWNRDSELLMSLKIRNFLANRFFRIAPLYFLYIIFYWFFNDLDNSKFEWNILFATIFFYNAWSPYLIPTVEGWNPVPGGWSISVEFMFYVLFPIFAVYVTTIRRVAFLIGSTYLIMLIANFIGQHLYTEITSISRENFLFFWPPNQIMVFSVGFLLYYSIKSEKISLLILRSHINGDTALIFLGLILAVLQFYDGAEWPITAFFLPRHIVVSFLFAVYALFAILTPSTYATNKIIVNIGKKSFGIYLVHFSVLSILNTLLKMIWPFSFDGIFSVVHMFILFLTSIFVSYQVSRVTFFLIEAPFINFGKSLFVQRRKVADGQGLQNANSSISLN